MLNAPLPRFRLYTTAGRYAAVFREILLNTAGSGNDVDRLEEAVAAFTGVAHGIAMPLARTGIYLALKNLIRPGQKVICSPITIVDVINMIICAGGIPVFADVEHGTCNIDPEAIRRLIDPQTGAVFVTHLHGLSCNLDPIIELCRSHGIPLAEDAAQAFSTKYHGQRVGSFGDAGIFSFGLYKNINAFYGGMVVTNSAEFEASLRKATSGFPVDDRAHYIKRVVFGLTTDLATHPLPFSLLTFWLFKQGYLRDIRALNKMVTVDLKPELITSVPEQYLRRMMPLQARLALPQIPDADANNLARIRAAELYHEGLKDIPELLLPPLRSDGSHTYTYYPLHCPDRHALMRHALLHNRDFVLSHYHNCASLPCFSAWAADCPEAEYTSKHLIYLPTYPRYAEQEILRNIEVIRKLYRRPAP